MTPGWPHRDDDQQGLARILTTQKETTMTEPLSQQVETAPTPEPLVKAELVRTLLLLAAGVLGVTIPDPVLALVLPSVVVAATVAVSWVLTMVSRGKVLALREGIDLNSLLDALRRA